MQPKKQKDEETRDAPPAPEASDTPEAPETTQEDDLEAIRAQLQEAQAALTEKDDRISELEADLAEVKPTAERFPELSNAYDILKADFESSQQDRAALTDAGARATQKYLEAVRVLNAGIPANLIDGKTIEEIDESVARGQEITDHVRAALVAESKNARVPAGAPTRAVNLDGLTADELIRLGIQEQIGGIEK
ncbi:MAG: hypothetical protein ACNA7X_04345 [Dehalococcoidia bacterium]